MHKWTEKEITFLRENYKKLSYDQIACSLGLTMEQVRNAAKRYRITVTREWSKPDLELLRKLYPDSPTIDLVERLGRSLKSIYAHAKKLGLKKSDAFNNSDLSGRMTKENRIRRGLDHRFPKGHVPANKGLRRPGYAPGNMAKTQFKKGHLPHNCVPVGTEVIRTDGYRKIKIAEPNVWEFIHRRVWERHNGPVPKGKMIRFRDGDHMNCEIENLMMVTRVEHALYNSMWKFPEEVIPAMAALSELKREIKNAEKQDD